jgi:hypothetical protein
MGASRAVKSFAGGFGGDVLVSGDDGYDEARSLWNGDIDRKPAVIARCSTAEQVAAAIRFGREQELEIAVRGGGHNYAGHGACDDGLMIDLSPMAGVTVDPGARRARCGGGTTWADFDAATQAQGLATPGGVISHTGVGGLTLGGGIGWLSRKAGLSCDNLVGAQVVTAAGDIVTASAQANTDLFWALHGGGGNFGVVTEFEFALHEVGPLVQLGLFFWEIDRGDEMLRFTRDYLDTIPRDMGVQLVGLNAPPAPFVPEQYHFAPGYVLAVVGWGTPEQHADAIAAIRAATPTFELVTPIPYTELQKMLDESAPWGILGYEKAMYLDALSDGAIEVVTTNLPRKASPMSIMPVFALGGAYSDHAEDETAFGGSRASQWLFNISATAPDPELLATDRAWVRSFWDALLPYASGTGSYVNFIADVGDDARVRASYGKEKYDRLAGIKATYDPDNTFHYNANIKPA